MEQIFHIFMGKRKLGKDLWYLAMQVCFGLVWFLMFCSLLVFPLGCYFHFGVFTPLCTPLLCPKHYIKVPNGSKRQIQRYQGIC